MATSRLNLKTQLIKSATPGSILATNTSNEIDFVAPPAGHRLWGYDHTDTATVGMIIGTNLSYDPGTNTLSATAGAGGYSDVLNDGSGFTNSNTNTKLDFIGSALQASDGGSGKTSITLATILNTIATDGAVTLSTSVTGTLPVANGGTGATTLTGILQGNGTGAVTAITNSSTAGQVLRVTGTNTYGWGALDLADADAITGDLPLANLAQGSALSVLGVGGNSIADNASIVAGSDNQVLRRSGTTLGFGSINLASTNAVTGVLAIANGGTGSSTQNFVDLSNTQSVAGNKTFSGNTTFSNNVTINATPSASTDAATVGWVLNNVAGLRSGSVRVATTAALTATSQNATTITLGGTSLTIDTISLANGDTVLVKDSVSGGGGGTFNNGVYSVGGIGSSVVLTRVAWMDTAAEIDGVYVLVQDGSSNVGTLWFTVSEVTTLGTDAISFTQIQTTGTVGGSAGVTNTLAYWSATNTIDDAALSYTNGSVFALGTTSAAASTILTTRGTGTGNSTYGKVHQNSSGTQVFRIADDGTTVIGSGTPLTITLDTLSRGGDIDLSSTLTAGSIRLFNTAVTTSPNNVVEINPTVSRSHTSGSHVELSTLGSYTTSSGTGNFTSIAVSNTINQSGGTGVVRGLHVNPTLTSAQDYRGVEITTSATQYALWTTAGKVRFDLGSDATGDLFTRASGGELARIAAGTSGHVLTSNGAGTAPTYQALPSTGTTVTRAYITGQTTNTFDLDANTGVVKDRNNNNVAFTIPTATDQFFVYLNGQRLLQGGTGDNRDYSVNTTTHVLTLEFSLVSTDVLLVEKFS